MNMIPSHFVLFLAACVVLLCDSALALSPSLLADRMRSHALHAEAATNTPNYQYQTKWFTARLDNFDFYNTQATFQQRYLINTSYWAPPIANQTKGGPIFFYTGNEGPIDLFANNTGLMWEIAQEFQAMLVFVEHRYYGETLPFGNNSYTSENLQYLTSEQALADYAVFIASLKQNYSCPYAPVISFGGSYGGMLSAWFRIKYPHVVAGAIAASAPIRQFTDTVDSGTYSRICSDNFRNVSQMCYDQIEASWTALTNISTQPNGLQKLESLLHLCPGTLQQPSDVQNILWPWAANVWSSMPMGNYPYPASFIAPLPGNPVNVVCSFFTTPQPTDTQIVQSLYQAMNLFYNYTNQFPTCNNISQQTGLATLGPDVGWSYQSCTEMIMPIGQYGGDSDFFYYAPWNLTASILGCQQQFQTTPRPFWIMTQYGAHYHELKSASNIVFSNGNLDPWSGGGILHDVNPTVVSLFIIGGAHHLDLRASNPLDPQSVIDVRNQEKQWIRNFIANPNPLAPNCSDDVGMNRSALVLVSVFTTLVATLVAIGAYAYCTKKQSGDSYQDIRG